jgi:hypothetical protein
LSAFLVLTVLAVIAAALATAYCLYVALLYAGVWVRWHGDGPRVLVVTSNSPYWGERIEAELLPRLPVSSVVVNWSDRKHWSKQALTTKLFNHFLGSIEHTPSVIVFHPWQRAEVFRFYSAYKQYKRGDPEPLDRLEAQLLASLRRA